MAAEGRIQLRLIPLSGRLIFQIGPFVLVDLEEGKSALLYRETADGDEIIHDLPTVQGHRKRFDQMWRVALDEENSLERIADRKFAVVDLDDQVSINVGRTAGTDLAVNAAQASLVKRRTGLGSRVAHRVLVTGPRVSTHAPVSHRWLRCHPMSVPPVHDLPRLEGLQGPTDTRSVTRNARNVPEDGGLRGRNFAAA